MEPLISTFFNSSSMILGLVLTIERKIDSCCILNWRIVFWEFDNYLNRILLKIFCAHLMRKFTIIYTEENLLVFFIVESWKYIFSICSNLTFDMIKYLYYYYYIIYNLYIIAINIWKIFLLGIVLVGLEKMKMDILFVL